MNLLIELRYLSAFFLQDAGIALLLQQFPPEALSGIGSEVLIELVPLEKFLVAEHHRHIYGTDLEYVLLMLLNQSLLNFDFLPEDDELLVDRRRAELAVHNLEDGLEFVVKLILLDEGVNDPDINVVGELCDRISNHHSQKLVVALPHAVDVMLDLVNAVQSLLKGQLLPAFR